MKLLDLKLKDIGTKDFVSTIRSRASPALHTQVNIMLILSVKEQNVKTIVS